MAVVAFMEEELQNSVVMSDEDAEYEEDDELDGNGMTENADAYALNAQLQSGIAERAGAEDDGEEDEDEDEDAEGEPDVLSDEDAEGEEEEEVALPASEEEDDPEDEEGVGAVKIHPSLLEDDDNATSGEEEEEESSASEDDDDESKDSTDAEVEVEWEPAAEDEDDAVNPNHCIFCQQDEENDPSEEFELYLACNVCGDNAHRQCARNANALKSEDEADSWYCPGCVANRLVPDTTVTTSSDELHDPSSPSVARDRVPGDLLPSHRGSVKPDSHSVFSQLIAPDDPMDGSRLLRKRKQSSGDAEHEDVVSLRTRGRETREIHDKETSSRSTIQSLDGEADFGEIDVDKGDNQIVANGHVKQGEQSSRASRSLRQKPAVQGKALTTTTEKTPASFKLIFRVDPIELRHILSIAPKPKKKRPRPTPSRARARSSAITPVYIPSGYTQPFYSLHEKEMDEFKSKPYGGILTEAEADTSLTLPKPENRRQFDEARQKAEEDWKARVAAAASAAAISGVKKPRKVSGPASQIEYIEFGQYQIDIWYAAPYPEEYSRNKALFICEFCLKYMESDIVAWRHKTKCPWKHPPGDEIYRDGKVMIFEVDGRKNPLYCQNLCLLAKLFLGSKTLYYDVEPFLFYVMTEYDEFGCHFVGYFSKEKRPSSLNNVSCILVLPIHQRKGYGHLLIDFSYLLTRVEKKTGSPEKPLSDMGLVSYRNYWRLVLCYYLRKFRPGDRVPSIKTISDDMGLTPDDVVSGLDALGSLVRDPVTGTYAIRLTTDYYEGVIHQHESKGYAALNPKALIWTPYIMGRNNASAFDLAPPLNTVAPRDDEDEEESPDLPPLTNGKRNRDAFQGMNGDADELTDDLEQLTVVGDTIKVDPSEEGSGSSGNTNGVPHKPTYYDRALSIPATRFEVYPPAPTTRKGTAVRPSALRATPRSAAPGSARSNGRRSAARRTTTSRRTANRRRSGTTGGTGRGPGRWPKGTKKSDFGNAESGPGLPPSMQKLRSRLGNEVLLGDEVEDDDYEDEEGRHGLLGEDGEDDDDAILYETPAPRSRRNRDINRGRGLGKPTLLGKPNMGLGQALGKPVPGDEDVMEVETIVPIISDMDIDAEGEDE